LTVQAPNGARRDYSLCNDPAERHRVRVRGAARCGGRGGSVSLVEGVGAGATLPVSAPRNDFALVANAPSFLFIAGGSASRRSGR